jgi:hypothetical protein
MLCANRSRLAVCFRTRRCGTLILTSAVAYHDDIERLGQRYQNVAVSGVCTDEQREIVFAAGQRILTWPLPTRRRPDCTGSPRPSP